MSELVGRLGLRRDGYERARVVELALWGVAIGVALVFAAIKIAAWGPVDAPEQSDFGSYYLAARVSAISPDDIYHPENWPRIAGTDLGSGLPFLYPPAFAWALRPLADLPYEVARRVWFWGSALALALTFLCLLRLPGKRSHLVWGAILWLLLPATLDTLHLGQVNAILALIVTLGVVGTGASRGWGRLVAGGLVGLAGGVKIFPLVLIVVAPWRGKKPYALGLVAGLAALSLAGLLSLPTSTSAEFGRVFWQTATTLSPPGLSILQNQSLLAFWRKLSFEGDIPLVLQGNSLGVLSASPLVPAGIATVAGWASVLVVIGFTIAALRRIFRQSHARYLEASALLLVAALIVSPVMWWHYLTIAAPAFPGLLAAASPSDGREIRYWRLLLPVGYLLIVLQRGMMMWLKAVPVLPSSSVLLIGLVLWWLVLVWRGMGVRIWVKWHR